MAATELTKISPKALKRNQLYSEELGIVLKRARDGGHFKCATLDTVDTGHWDVRSGRAQGLLIRS